MDINNLSREELIEKIINQENSLNKKIKKFRKDNIEEHFNMVKNYLGEDVQFNKSNVIAKSRKFHESQGTLTLKRTLSALHKLNNHDIYGTVNKYNKFATAKWEILQETVKQELLSRGYSEKEIQNAITSKDFYDKLYVAFADKEKYGDSDDIIELTYLDYKDNGLSEDEIDRISTSIDHSIKAQEELFEELRQYDAFKNAREGNMR